MYSYSDHSVNTISSKPYLKGLIFHRSGLTRALALTVDPILARPIQSDKRTMRLLTYHVGSGLLSTTL